MIRKNQHWENQSLLKSDAEMILEFLGESEVVICRDEKQKCLAKKALAPVLEVFYDQILSSGISAIYIYDQNLQRPERRNLGGVYSFTMRRDGKIVSCIGISLQVIGCGSDSAALMFLHELAHTVCIESPLLDSLMVNDHDDLYMTVLDRMVEIYNEATNSRLTNLYRGRYSDNGSVL